MHQVKAIQEKYGDETIQNPKVTWDQEKEKKYLEQIKKIYQTAKPKEKIEVDGVFVPKKLFTKDDLYMAKFKCCFMCYVQYVEGREKKWLNQLNSPEKN